MKLQLRETILRRLEDGPLGKKILAEAEAAAAAERSALQAQLRKATADFQADQEPLLKAFDAAKAKHDAAEAALKAAREKLAEANVALRSRVHAYDTTKARLERQLADSAPELIDEFVAELDRRLDQLRENRWDTVVGPRTMAGQPAWSFTNRESFDRALQSVMDARRAARDLATDADVEDFPGAIEKIRASILEVEPVKVPKRLQTEVETGLGSGRVSVYGERGVLAFE